MTNDKALEVALLNCPFCGGTPILSKRGGSSEVNGYTTFHVVSCKSCHVEKYAYSKPYTGPSEEVAIGSVTAAWNRRAPVSALPGEAEVVERLSKLTSPDAEMLSDGYRLTEIIKLNPADALQAMQARAEAAERELSNMLQGVSYEES